MMGWQSGLKRCPFCEGVFFTDQVLTAAASVEPAMPAEPIPQATELTAHQLYAALSTGIARGDQELQYLRIFCWWLFNDPMRTNNRAIARDKPWQPSPELRDNLLALQPLLDVRIDRDRRLLAEIARELGNFTSALHLMAGFTDEDAETIRELISRRAQQPVPFVRTPDPLVVRLFFDDELGSTGYKILEPNETIVVGSDARCAIKTSSRGVAAEHCRIMRSADDRVTVEAIGDNVIQVNNRREQFAEMQSHHHVRCGTMLVQFSISRERK
jgi:hypothetical protein